MRLSEQQIAALEENGFRRWTKGNMDRLYIGAEALGLEIERYKRSGYVSSAYYRGERLSHNRGNEMASAKTYIDVATGELKSTDRLLKEDAQELYEETMNALEDAEAEQIDENEEESFMNNNYSIKEKIVNTGESRVFNSWHEAAGITMDEFLDGLRWLCDDPMPGGRMSRELGCIRRAGACMTPEQAAVWGISEAPDEGSRLYRLTRCYYSDGRFAGLRDENGKAWGGWDACASINLGNRI